MTGLAVMVAVGLATAVTVRDAIGVGRALERAKQETQQARDALVAGDVPVASQHMATARAQLTTAVSATQRQLWQGIERVPLAGEPFAVLGEITDTAEVAIGLAYDLTSAAPEIIGADGRLQMSTIGDRVDLSPLLAARDALASARLSRLARSTDSLRARTDSPFVPARVDDARRSTLELADQVLDEVGRAQLLTSVLPPYLGVDAPRRYFLAMQNPAELRGTGGLIGFYAVVTVDNGRFEMTSPTSYEVLSPVREPIDRATSLAPPTDFQERYGTAGAATFLANINLDPSLPTVAPRILDLYEAARGERLDGVIMVDPLGLRDVLREIGPVRVPAAVGDPRLPNPVPVDDLPRTLMVDAYDVLGGNTPERETYLRELATRAFEKVFAGGWEAVPVTTSVARTALDGHIQLYSTVEEEQDALSRLGIGGTIEGRDGADWLAVTAVNAAGNKADMFAGHVLAADISLGRGADGWVRLGDLRVGVENRLPTSGHDPYILLSAEPGRGFEDGFDGPRGLNRTRFTLWTDPASVPTEVDGGRARTTGLIDGRRGTDHTLATPSLTSGTFGAAWAGPVEMVRDGDVWVYRLHLHRQPKTMPDRITLRVAAPDGWDVVDATLEGGGRGDGYGPHGEDGPAPGLEVDAGIVVVRGDVTRSLDLEVRMVPADGSISEGRAHR